MIFRNNFVSSTRNCGSNATITVQTVNGYRITCLNHKVTVNVHKVRSQSSTILLSAVVGHVRFKNNQRTSNGIGQYGQAVVNVRQTERIELFRRQSIAVSPF